MVGMMKGALNHVRAGAVIALVAALAVVLALVAAAKTIHDSRGVAGSARRQSPPTTTTTDPEVRPLAELVLDQPQALGLASVAATDHDGSQLPSAKQTRAPKSGLAANRAAGNAARDFVAQREAPALIEQSRRTTGGLRRTDVVKETLERLGVEVKVGRTGLTGAVRQELARDLKLLRAGTYDKMRWEFFRSLRTGKGGPTARLRAKLGKYGIEIVEHPTAF